MSRLRHAAPFAAAAVMLALLGVGTSAASSKGPAGAFFLTNCRFSHSAPNDPIVYPGLPFHSHDHVFIGNVSTNAFSTPASLAGHRTTCGDSGDLSAYWAPMLYENGNEIRPLEATIYYRRLTKAPVHMFPAGLEMVAGNSHAVTQQSPSVTQWYCGVLKSSFYGPLARSSNAQAAAPVPNLSDSGLPRCALPVSLELQVNFPDCSDGKATSADHKSHMAYSRDGRCPASHPVPVPAISIVLRYPPVTGDNVFLSSGGIYSGHADFMDGWKNAALLKLVTGCLDRYVGCGVAGEPALNVS